MQTSERDGVEPGRHEIVTVISSVDVIRKSPNVRLTSNRDRAPAAGLVAPNIERSVTSAVLTRRETQRSGEIGCRSFVPKSSGQCAVENAVVSTCCSNDVRVNPPPNSTRMIWLNG